MRDVVIYRNVSYQVLITRIDKRIVFVAFYVINLSAIQLDE